MILIRKVADDYGWLGNMSPFTVTYEGSSYRTAEALFQCMRFSDEQIRSLIRAQKSPMGAKMIAKKHRVQMKVEPMSTFDIENMRRCLKLKIEQHPVLKTRLMATGTEWIVEDCTKRPRTSGLFWGAALKENQWHGENCLGVLWMEIRDALRTVA